MKAIEPKTSGAGLKIGIAVARFNPEIGQGELRGCLDALRELGLAEDDIVVVNVAGSLEVPIALQRLAQTRKFNALIALGAVIRGETYHFEVVSNESAAGLMQVQLDTGIPIANGILTTDTEEQAMARMARKGKDCAEVAVEMSNLLRAIDEIQVRA
jgi:6,7-dimethyl-8-ribityllumazine synthase